MACAADNINGAQVFHTARFNRFIDCEAIRCFISFKNYSRDEFSADGVGGVNTNGVIPSYDTQFINCNTIGTTVYPFMVGDDPGTATTTRALLIPELVKIRDLPYSLENPGFIRIEAVNKCLISGCEFGAGINVRSIAGFTSGLIIDESNTVISTSTGDEVSDIVVNDNATTIKLHKWCPNQRVLIQNTVDTTINSTTDAVENHKYNFVIDDSYTRLFIFGGQGYLGQDVEVRAALRNTAWSAIETVGTERSSIPADLGSIGASVSIDLLANRSDYFTMTTTTNVGGVSVANITSFQNGDILTFEMDTFVSDKLIGGWSSSFLFSSAAPSQIFAGETLQLRFKKIQRAAVHRFIEISRFSYTTP
tara:strand:- start:757 stop:1848 length:1092 start_codon:yes stop_codon:yes gene_type:complete